MYHFFFPLAGALPFGLTDLINRSLVKSFTCSSSPLSDSGSSGIGSSSYITELAVFPTRVAQNTDTTHLDHLFVIGHGARVCDLALGSCKHVALVECNRVIRFVVPESVSSVPQMSRSQKDDVQSGECSLHRRWDLLQYQIVFHGIHSKLHKGIPILFAQVIFVHVRNDLFDGILNSSAAVLQRARTWTHSPIFD